MASRESPIDDMPQRISYLTQAVDAIEDRLLRLTKDAARGGGSIEELIAEVPLLVKDLRGIFRQLVELKERRDLSFKVFQKLRVAEVQSLWLYRKIHFEESFYKKLHLEEKLRTVISTDAFAVYLELLESEDQERELERKPDCEISRRLLGELPEAP